MVLPQTLEARMTNGSMLITLVGEIDMSRSPELHSASDAFRESRSAHAVVDMSGVSFCGSEGVHLLTRLLTVAQSRGGTVTVTNPSDTVSRLLTICGLDDRIHQHRHDSRLA
jgi:anti-sigma B factor antagonist